MKSSYELAMERLKKQNPEAAAPLTGKQKKKLAELDRLYRAKVAEKELALQPQITEARLQGDEEKAAAVEKQLREEKQSLQEEMERKKDQVRQEKA